MLKRKRSQSRVAAIFWIKEGGQREKIWGSEIIKNVQTVAGVIRLYYVNHIHMYVCMYVLITFSTPRIIDGLYRLRRKTFHLEDSLPPHNSDKASNMSDYDYTTGGEALVRHVSLIDRGGFGEVHKVGSLIRQ